MLFTNWQRVYSSFRARKWWNPIQANGKTSRKHFLHALQTFQANSRGPNKIDLNGKHDKTNVLWRVLLGYFQKQELHFDWHLHAGFTIPQGVVGRWLEGYWPNWRTKAVCTSNGGEDSPWWTGNGWQGSVCEAPVRLRTVRKVKCWHTMRLLTAGLQPPALPFLMVSADCPSFDMQSSTFCPLYWLNTFRLPWWYHPFRNQH